MSLRRDGRNPLSYMGVRPQQAAAIVQKNRRPTTTDVQNFDLGQFWFIPKRSTSPSEELWLLVGNAENVATWINVAASTGELDVRFLTGNSGGAVAPDSGNNINIIGSGDIVVTGTPVNNTLTISASNPSTAARLIQVTLTSQQIKALDVTPVQIIAAGGANTIVTVLQWTSYYSYGGTSPFVTSGNPSLGLTYGPNTLSSPSLVGAVSLSIPTSTFIGTSSLGFTGYAIANDLSGNTFLNVFGSGTATNLSIYASLIQPANPFTGNAENNNNLVLMILYSVMNLP